MEKKFQLKKNGAVYVVSPWALTWEDEKYYLIAYDETAQKMKHYRVDKMQHLDLEQTERVGRQQFERFDLGTFAKKTFGMYGGHDEEVVLYCHNDLAGVILDRFGSDVILIPEENEHFRVRVSVTVSRQFFGWLTGIGEKMQLVEPESVRLEYRAYLTQLLKQL